jgi:hypothetical protein
MENTLELFGGLQSGPRPRGGGGAGRVPGRGSGGARPYAHLGPGGGRSWGGECAGVGAQ